MTTRRPDGGLAQEVQRFGLLSAATVVDRYNHMVDRAIAEEGVGFDPGPVEGLDPAALVDGAARLAQAYLRFLDTTAGLLATREATDSTRAPERVVMPGTKPGGRSRGTVWAHNPTGEAATGIAVEVTGLVSPDREAIPAEAVTVTPDRLGRLDAETSIELSLAVEVPVDQPPGWYFGLVRIGDDPGNPVALHLEVTRS